MENRLIALCLDFFFFFFLRLVILFEIVLLSHYLGIVFNMVSAILQKPSIAFSFIFLTIVNSDLFLDI